MTASLARPAALARQLGASPRVSVTHLVLRAAALSLREHPRLNGRVAGDAVETSDAVHVGLAVDVDEAVVVPVVRDADRKSVAELAAECAALAAAARAGRLAPAAAQGGTFTVSTLGAAGADWFTPILNAPQIAILGVGAVAPRPVVRGGAVVAAPTVHLTLVFDHRAVDGVPAARFLAAVRARLESAPGPGAGAPPVDVRRAGGRRRARAARRPRCGRAGRPPRDGRRRRLRRPAPPRRLGGPPGRAPARRAQPRADVPLVRDGARGRAPHARDRVPDGGAGRRARRPRARVGVLRRARAVGGRDGGGTEARRARAAPAHERRA